MFRRSFFHAVIGGIASLLVHREVEESYLYDWQKGISTDPKLKGDLPYLWHCPTMGISVNGKELDLCGLYVTKCQTGPSGWVEGIVRENGEIVIDRHEGTVKTWRLSGNIQFWMEKETGVVETTSIHNQKFRTFSPKESKQ